MSDQGVGLVQLGTIRPSVERSRLERRARLLAWGGIGWHVVEFAIAVGAGIAAGSIALIGFGADSLIEALAGFVVVWLFTGDRRSSQTAERRAQQLIAASFFVLAAYVGVEAVRSTRRRRPSGGELDRDRPRRLHRADDAAARAREAPRRQRTALLRDRQRGQPDP